MNKSEFFGIMGIITSQFGEKNYGPSRLEIIYNAVSGLDGEEFKSICNRLVGNSRYAPLLDDFVSFAKPILANKPKQKSNCFQCNGTGLVSKYHIESNVNYAFACSCSEGNSFSAYNKWQYAQKNLFQDQQSKNKFNFKTKGITVK